MKKTLLTLALAALAAGAALFPIIINSNKNLVQGTVTEDKLEIIVTDPSGKKVDGLTVRK